MHSLRLSLLHSYTLSLSNRCTPTRIHTHSLSLVHILVLSHLPPLSRTHSLFQITHTHTHTHTLSLSLSLSYTCSFSLTLFLSHTHTLSFKTTHTIPFTLVLFSLPLSLSLSFSFSLKNIFCFVIESTFWFEKSFCKIAKIKTLLQGKPTIVIQICFVSK